MRLTPVEDSNTILNSHILFRNRPAEERRTGYDIRLGDDSIWILHAIFKRRTGSAFSRQNAEEGAIGDEEDNSPDLSTPDPKIWERVRWMDVLRRDPKSFSVPPSYRWLSHLPAYSASADFVYPAEGSLDMETLGAIIKAVSDFAGTENEIFAYYAEMAARNTALASRRLSPLWRGTITAIPDLLEPNSGPYRVTPSNVWAADQTWCWWTDWDLMATKFCGSSELVAALEKNTFLDTLRWSPRGA